MQGTLRIERAAAWLSALALLLAAASPALAQHAAKKDHAAPSDDAAEVTGLTAAVDPATGKLRALTPEEARALLDGISRYVDQSSDGLAQQNYSDGSASIDLDERFQSVVVARAGADGKAAARCVTSLAEANSFRAVRDGEAKTAPSGKRAKIAAKRIPVVAAPAALEEK
jgi:hypothetical protein